MKPLFGTLNASVAKAIAANTPKKYNRLVEPFGDGGTLAFQTNMKKPKEHILNVLDEELFFMLDYVKNISSGDKAKLKKYDWVASQETFDKVISINAEAGPERFYKFMYLKKFGMQMDKEQPPVLDVLSIGEDESMLIFTIPMMKVALKKTTIINEDPFKVMSQYGGGDDFMVILPKSTEDAESAESKLGGISGNFFFAAKRPDAEAIIEDAKKYSELKVSALSAPSIMMAKMSAITNYDSKLTAIVPEEIGMNM
jgi:hypothetical protein